MACPPEHSFFQSSSPANPCYDHRPETSMFNVVADVGDGDKAEEMGSWSFLQSLSNTNGAENKVYVHSLVEPTSAKLSKKSLEMCTEGLGSETGNNVIENMEEISLLLLGTKREALKTEDEEKMSSRKRLNRTMNFPPSIRSIRGSDGVKMKPHREGGRLVLEAVSVTCSPSCFHVERSEGRLRLCLLKDSYFELGDKNTTQSANEQKEESERCGEGTAEKEGINGFTEKLYGLSSGCKSCSGGSGAGGCSGGGGDGGSGQKGLMNWETFVVAT